MAITPAMRQNAQFGLEATEGAGATVTRQFTSFGLSATDNTSVWSVRPRGQTATTSGGTSWADSAFAIDGGVLSYDEVCYWAESAFNKVTATTPAGGTTSKQRIYSIDQFAAQTFQSFKVEVGNKGTPNRGVSAVGVSADAWGYSVSVGDDSAEMTGSMLGGVLTDPATMTTAGITVSNYTPALPTQCKVYYATSAANLTASPTEITNAFTASFDISDRRSLYRFLGNTTGGAAGTVETVPGLEFNLTLADETAPLDTLLTSLRAGTKLFFRVEFLGATIEAAIKYTFSHDMCCVLRDTPERDDNLEVQSRNLPLQLAYDATWANSTKLTIINTLATL